jgi:hypothetical protein
MERKVKYDYFLIVIFLVVTPFSFSIVTRYNPSCNDEVVIVVEIEFDCTD